MQWPLLYLCLYWPDVLEFAREIFLELLELRDEDGDGVVVEVEEMMDFIQDLHHHTHLSAVVIVLRIKGGDLVSGVELQEVQLRDTQWGGIVVEVRDPPGLMTLDLDLEKEVRVLLRSSRQRLQGLDSDRRREGRIYSKVEHLDKR